MHMLFRSLLAASLVAISTVSAQQGTAVYELTFASTWSKTTHPVDFPSFPHYSSLIGGTHNSSVQFWKEGGLATSGIEAMAELGSTSGIRSEVQAAITKGAARSVVAGPGLGNSPGSTKMRFTIEATHPQLTLVSMLAPSPDWFIGVSGLDLMKNGQWIDKTVVTLHLYDAGTDSGPSYASPNMDTQPRDKIARITTASGPFKGRTTVVGSFTIQRVAETLVYGCQVNPARSMTTDGSALLGNTVRALIDDPLRSVRTGSFTLLLLSLTATPSYPCGIKIPGIGLGKPGATGELLIGAPIATLLGPMWQAFPTPFGLTIPNQSSLVGARLFVQGALIDGTRVGVTDAMQLVIGQ